jgi:hypothetical protein
MMDLNFPLKVEKQKDGKVKVLENVVLNIQRTEKPWLWKIRLLVKQGENRKRLYIVIFDSEKNIAYLNIPEKEKSLIRLVKAISKTLNDDETKIVKFKNYASRK